MAVSDYSTTPASNTAISGINIAEGCSPANINNAIRQLMADVKAYYNAAPPNAALTSIAGLTTAADKSIYTTASNTYATYDLTATGRAVAGAADAAAARTALGLTIGTNVQAYDAALSTLAALPLVAGDLFYALGAEQITTLAKGLPFARLKMDSTGAFPEWGPINQGALTSTASGGPYSFNIPEGVSRIEVLFDKISLDSTGNWFVQIGPSSGVVTTGYESSSSSRGAGSGPITNGFIILSNAASRTLTGRMTLTLMDSGTNLWISDHTVSSVVADETFSGGGRIALSGTLQRFRLNFSAGNNPDGGQFRIQYE
jgi:hypothetical protein